MAPQMARGVLTEASFKAISNKCMNEEVLTTKISEHAAQLLGYSGFLRAWAAKQAAFQVWAEDCLEKAKVFCASSVVKTAELGRIAKEEVTRVREEFLKGHEELLKDFSQKMSDLGSKVVELTSANEAYQKGKAEESALLAKALATNAE